VHRNRQSDRPDHAFVNDLATSPCGSPVAEAADMTNTTFATITDLDLSHVTGGADDGGGGAVCTTANPSGAAPPQPKQFFENSHAGPSTNDSVMNSTNTLMSRGMSMLNDGRPSMPAQW
jgi:hypothetical protein